jgi:hypothetical protein
MNERKTLSILHRVPVILAATAASYGLPLQAQTTQRIVGHSLSRPAAADSERPMHNRRLVRQR